MEFFIKKIKFKEGYGNVDKNVIIDFLVFVFDYDMFYFFDLVYKYEIRKWFLLIVDKVDIEKIVESILEKIVEKVLKNIFWLICSELLWFIFFEDLEVFIDRFIE